MFVSTDARRPYPRGVIGNTVGAYRRGTGSNPVDGNGHFFPSYRQLYLSSFSDTHTVRQEDRAVVLKQATIHEVQDNPTPF